MAKLGEIGPVTRRESKTARVPWLPVEVPCDKCRRVAADGMRKVVQKVEKGKLASVNHETVQFAG